MLKIYKNFNLSKIHKKSILLIGNFDGLHLGHQKLFKLAKKYSKKHKVKFGVLTFDPLPVMFFNKKLTNYRITSNLQKNLLFEKAGVDFVIVSRFNKSFSKISADNFIKKIIVKKINPNFIFVSNNFKYGFRRAGNVAKLISKVNIYNYKIIKPSPLKKRKKIISSTLIRKLLQKGELKNANKLLGRNWSIIGVVQKGRRIGKKLGIPTCNIDIKNYVIAKPGVYSVRVKVNNSNKIFKGIANLGYRPTFGEKKILLEVNLFNFSGNLYNKSLNVSFCNFIRSEKKFNDHQDLIKQIEKDLKQAKFDLKKNNE